MEEALSGHPRLFEWRLQWGDGTGLDAEMSLTRMDLSGRPCLQAIVTDISERVRAEEGLRKFPWLVEQSPACMVVTDPDGNIEYVNRKFHELTGYPPAEVLGKNPRILRSGLTSPETYEALWRAIKAGGEWRGKFCNRKKNGELRREDAAIGPIRDPQGRIRHLLAVKEDVTVQKQAGAGSRPRGVVRSSAPKAARGPAPGARRIAPPGAARAAVWHPRPLRA